MLACRVTPKRKCRLLSWHLAKNKLYQELTVIGWQINVRKSPKILPLESMNSLTPEWLIQLKFSPGVILNYFKTNKGCIAFIHSCHVLPHIPPAGSLLSLLYVECMFGIKLDTVFLSSLVFFFLIWYSGSEGQRTEILSYVFTWIIFSSILSPAPGSLLSLLMSL